MAYIELYTAIVAGFISHRFIFKTGEWHLQATTLLILYVLSFIFIAILETETRQISWKRGTMWSASVLAIYAIGLWTSMIIYRVFLHPLRRFPGPRAASISKLWHVVQCRDSKNHLLMEELFSKYGSFVRIGKTIFRSHESLD